MKTMNMKKYTLALLFLSTASFAYAKDEKIQYDAHQHGVAEINIVWDKEDVNIELLSPAFNITGFEFQPANHEQKEVVAQIEKKLNTPNELFSFKGASCRAVKTDIDSPFEEDAEHKDHDHEEHAKHEEHEEHEEHESKEEDDDHKDHAEHESKEEHEDHEEHAEHDEHSEHDDDHGKSSSSTHSEYSISYEFSCSNSKAELTIAIDNLFKYFPQMEKINVQWLSPTQQSSSILTKKNTSIILK